MARKAGLLPEPCPVCGKKEGRIEDYEYAKSYEIKDPAKFDRSTITEKDIPATDKDPNGKKLYFRFSRKYRPIQIIHRDDIEPCKLKPEDAERFLGLKYKEQTEKFLLVCTNFKAFCAQVIDYLELCKALIKVGIPDIFARILTQDIDKILQDCKECSQLMSSYEQACIEGTITEKIDLDELDDYVRGVEFQSHLMKRAFQLTLVGGTEEEAQELVSQIFNNAVSMTPDEQHNSDLEFDEMLSILKQNATSFVPQRMDLIVKALNGDHPSDAIDKFKIDLTKLAINGQGSEDFEQIFDSKPNQYLHHIIQMYSPSLLSAMKIIIKRNPKRFGKPPASINDLSRLPQRWQAWYMLLSKMVKERNAMLDRRTKVLPSQYDELKKNVETFGIRAAGKKADISAKQVKRIQQRRKKSS